MMKKALLFTSIIILLGIFVSPLVMCNGASTISITPATTNVTVGEEFVVNVNLSYAADLYAFEFWLSFDKTKLECTDANGPVDAGYLNTPTLKLYNETNNAGGYVALAISTQLPTTSGVTGGGVLATIHFKALAAGTSPLHLYDTELYNSTAMEISHTTSDGTVTITPGMAPVGGKWVPIDKLAILAPWILFALAIFASASMFGLFRRHQRKQITCSPLFFLDIEL